MTPRRECRIVYVDGVDIGDTCHRSTETAMSILEGYTPKDLGLDGYESYRCDPVTGQQVQLEVVEFAAYTEKRVAACSVPTGVGKSLIALSLTKLTGARTVVLTATKGLQDQYVHDAARYGLVDMRGKDNYACADFSNLSCRDGSQVGCRYVNRGCTYECARGKARHSDLVCTNYSYWLSANDRAKGIEGEDNPVEMLILDEGHQAPDVLSDYLSVRVYESELKRWHGYKDLGEEIKNWREWIEESHAALELEDEINEIEHIVKKLARKHDLEKLYTLKKTYDKLGKIVEMRDEDTVIEKREGGRYGRTWDFDVVWPGRYAEQYLFCGVSKVVVMSATLRPKTMALLGVGKDEYEFREWQRIFPGNRHPIYSIPAKNQDGRDIRIDRRSNGSDLIRWVDHIDRIIDGRLDRKGIIQTVSYERQRFLLDHSKHRDLFLGNTADPDSETATGVAAEFRRSRPPAILCSPSFSTGWDFPKQECEYVVICKVPFKGNGSKVQKVREERDPQYGAYQAMLEMVQGSGRGMRSADDQCEVFIVDGHVNWFVFQNKNLAPGWFVRGMRKVVDIPEPPVRLDRFLSET